MLKLFYAIHPLFTGSGKVVEPIEGFQRLSCSLTPFRHVSDTWKTDVWARMGLVSDWSSSVNTPSAVHSELRHWLSCQLGVFPQSPRGSRWLRPGRPGLPQPCPPSLCSGLVTFSGFCVRGEGQVLGPHQDVSSVCGVLLCLVPHCGPQAQKRDQ